uniref:Uncharacterized protein n=1 Tax=Monodelphis domestica TaxID=13616 RepID=A0A5F8HEQ5_MONDO
TAPWAATATSWACNLQPALTYWSVFFRFGLCMGFLGPAVSDLCCQTHGSLPQISWVFFSKLFCLLLGSALGAKPKKKEKLGLPGTCKKLHPTLKVVMGKAS